MTVGWSVFPLRFVQIIFTAGTIIAADATVHVTLAGLTLAHDTLATHTTAVTTDHNNAQTMTR